MVRLLLAAVALVVVGLLIAPTADAPLSSSARAEALPAPLAWANPVLDDDYPDPSVLRVGDTYWATSTSSAHAPGFPLLQSSDLVHWQAAGTVFPSIPGWASDSLWAPELAQDGGTFLLYYAARRRHGPMCIAVATAAAPTGPWQDHGPIVCQRDGSIDPTRVVDGAGRPWLVWKEDGNSAGQKTTIWARRLRRNGVGVIGRKFALLRNEEAWEGTVVEAPELVAHDGWLYLFYSGNDCCSPKCRYAVGVARARSLLGPWQRDPHGPALRSTGVWRCPGHGSLVTDTAGQTLLLYHAMRARPRGDPRRFGLLDVVAFGADGWPLVNDGHGPSLQATLAP